MYILIFKAWAELMGFTLSGSILWAEDAVIGLVAGNTRALTTMEQLAMQDPATIVVLSNNEGVGNALMLTNLMTHASMILIFLFVVGFFVFLFKAVSSWVRR